MRADERFWAKVEKGDGCWLWTGGLNDKGYGTFYVAPKKHMGAHRWIYQRTHGEIPAGLEVNHQCHKDADCTAGRDCLHRRCVRPDHLTLETHSENLTGRTWKSSVPQPTRCPAGHPYEYKAPNGTYRCRICRATKERERRRLLRDARV